MSEQSGTLFEHCARALDRSLAVGSHGLPLIGTGDWNDGMNRVGREGKGESVWLGWFLHTILWEFARLADARGDRQRARCGDCMLVRSKRRSNARGGMASGIGVPTLTRGRRSAPREAKVARVMPQAVSSHRKRHARAGLSTRD